MSQLHPRVPPRLAVLALRGQLGGDAAVGEQRAGLFRSWSHLSEDQIILMVLKIMSSVSSVSSFYSKAGSDLDSQFFVMKRI